MKKFLTFTFAILLAFVLVACGSSSAKPESIEIKASSRAVRIGKTIQLTATVKPSGASQEVVWTSSNNAYATVSESGKVTGVGTGKAIITATSKEDSSVSAKITISVSESSGDDLDFSGYEIRIAYSPEVEYELDPRIDTTNVPEYSPSPTRKYSKQAWEEIEDKYGCKITVAGYRATDYYTRFNDIIDDGKNNTTEFDIYWVPTNQISNIYSVLLPMDDLYAAYGKNSMSDADKMARTYKNTLYGWSWTSGQITSDDAVIATNLNLLHQIGMDGDKEPAKLFMEDKWSIAEFEEWCLEAQTKLNSLPDATEENPYYVICGRMADWLRDLSRSCGIALADTLKFEINLDKPAVVDIANMLKRLYDAGCIDPSDDSSHSTSRIPSWQNQHALLNTGSSYFVNYKNRWKVNLWGDGDTHYGFVPWPYANDANHETARWGTYTQDCFVMPKAVTEKIKNAQNVSEDVTVENIFRIWVECYSRSQEIMNNAADYDKEKTDQINAENKWENEWGVKAWLYIQDNLSTKGIFELFYFD